MKVIIFQSLHYPVTHEVVLNNATCELKITGFGGAFQEANGGGEVGAGSTLKPGTPGPGGHYKVPYPNPRRSASHPRMPSTGSV